MWPVIINLGGIKITWFGLAMGLTFLVISFVLWRRMREDYKEEDILTFSIFATLAALIASLGWRWWSIGGFLITIWVAVYLWCKKKGWDYWEWLDLLLPLSLIVGIIGSVSWGPQLLLPAGILLVGYLLLVLFRSTYRSLRWYKSGRMGFVGLVGMIWWNIVWILIAKWQPSNVYLGGLKLEQWIGIWTILGCSVALYLRAGRKVTQDWKNFTKIWQPQKQKNP